MRLRWNERGIAAIEMPELSMRELRAQLREQDGAPDFVRTAARLLELHLAGTPQDLAQLPLDFTLLAPFQRQVLEAVRRLPPGQTASYGQVAALLGKPKASRAVGQALGRNPFLVAVPCHRVLAAGGAPGGFSAPGGVIAKQRLLALEGVELKVEHGLPFDPVEAHRALREADPRLARLMDRTTAYRVRPDRMQSPFAALVESIVYQQLNGRAAATILGRLVALFRPRRFPRPEDLLEARDSRLRSAGLSRAKAAAVKDLAAKTLDGTVPRSCSTLEKWSDDQIIDRLTQVRGVGRWTVEMLLIFRLARPDVLPVDDYGVRKGFALFRGLRELPTRDQLLAYGERWRPYRSVASWYMWRALDQARPPKAA
jgi:methylated-DNA-[protein]-cysteine S-methyltransferase